jgi:hypothetical protein
VEELRRFWQGRHYDGGPIEDFRAPQGTIAITLDVQGTAPSTFTLDVTALVDLMDQVNDIVCKADYHGVVRHIAHAFPEAKQTGDDVNFEVIGPLSLWSALHHPKQGAGMRAAVSEVLRCDGKAHISWCFSPTARDGTVGQVHGSGRAGRRVPAEHHDERRAAAEQATTNAALTGGFHCQLYPCAKKSGRHERDLLRWIIPGARTSQQSVARLNLNRKPLTHGRGLTTLPGGTPANAPLLGRISRMNRALLFTRSQGLSDISGGFGSKMAQNFAAHVKEQQRCDGKQLRLSLITSRSSW